jgi:alkylated DNA nucleotide flippase Atl1
MKEMTIKERVVEFVNLIPIGKVVSYGYIGSQVGSSGWGVGIILSGMSVEECKTVAWQRVVRKDGYISSLKLGYKGVLQKELLEVEGVNIINDFVDPEFIIG